MLETRVVKKAQNAPMPSEEQLIKESISVSPADTDKILRLLTKLKTGFRTSIESKTKLLTNKLKTGFRTLTA